MDQHQINDLELWQGIVARLDREFADLPPAERARLADELAAVARLQEEMHAVFLALDGETVCRDCVGYCCDRAKHHLTLVNLLAYWNDGERPPAPDFSLPCPFLAPTGCRHEVGRRPFNCVTFLCERLDERLDDAGRERFYALEKDLRRLYLAFEERFAGASLRGILIRAERLGDRPLLSPPVS